MCLRILHVVGSMECGGTESLIMNLYRKIDRSKIQFDFAVHSENPAVYDDEIRRLGGKIYYFPRYKGSNHIRYAQEWHSFFQLHPEHVIIHGHMRSTAAIYLRIAKKYNRTAIAHSHSTSSRGNAVDRFAKKILQYPLRHTADYFLACSLPAGLWLFGKKVCQSDRFWILKNAIDSDRFVFREDIRDKLRRDLDIEDKFVIGHVGNFDPVKNHVFLLDIFEQICQYDNNCILLLVGGGNNQIRAFIENLAKQKGLSEKIKFLGIRADVNELLNAFDLFLFPSLHEGLGIAAVEAQANGLKCIISDKIPQEIEISENLEFLSLKASAESWAERILTHKKGYIRKDMYEKIKLAGYDIYQTTQWLTKFYLQIY